MRDEQQLIFFDRAKLRRLAVGCAVFVAAGIWMLLIDDSTPARMGREEGAAFPHAVGVLAIVFFGIGVYLFGRKLASAEPAIRLDRDGFLVRSGAISPGRVAWSEVEGVDLLRIQWRELLVIKVKRPNAVIAQKSVYTQFLMRRILNRCGAPIVISNSLLGADAADLLSAFRRFAVRYGGA